MRIVVTILLLLFVLNISVLAQVSEINIDSTYIVAKDSVLVIPEGTHVHIAPHANIIINGTIIARGTKKKPILFSNLLYNADDSNAIDTSSIWGKIIFSGTASDSSVIDRCIFQYCEGIESHKDSFIVSNSYIRNTTEGIECHDNSFIFNNIFYRNGNDISLVGSLSDSIFFNIRNNNFLFSDTAISLNNRNFSDISMNIFYNNNTGITGNNLPDSTTVISHNLFYRNQQNVASVPVAGFGIKDSTNINGDSCDISLNIFENPFFVDSSGANLHLLFTSPCIDAGFNDSSIVKNDFDDNKRIIDGNNDSIAISDIGVYENPYTPIYFSVITKLPSSDSSSDGSIDITVHNGYTPLKFSWSTGDTTEDISGLMPGSYFINVIDKYNNKASEEIWLPAAYIPMKISITKKNASSSISNDGYIDISVSDGKKPYSYQWSTGTTTEDLYDIVAGTYFLTVTDSLQYKRIDSIEIAVVIPPIYISFNKQDVSFQGINDGYIDITVSGGSAPYTYRWSNNSTAQDIYNLSSGKYTVTVTDSLLNYTAKTIEIINAGSPFLVTYIKKDASTEGSSDGFINLMVSGARSPYSFRWSNSATTEDLFNIPAGHYSVEITDSINHSITFSIVIHASYEPIDISYIKKDVSGPGKNDGFIDITIEGGAFDLIYKWNNGSTNEDLANIDTGLYSLTVTDSKLQSTNITIRLSYIDTSRYIINGNIYAGNLPAAHCAVLAFIRENNLFSYAASTVVSSGGTYTISKLKNAEYLLFAVPDPAVYPSFIPTYYVNKPTWENANIIDLKGRAYDVDISLIKNSTFVKGNHKIRGYVVFEDSSNFQNNINTNFPFPHDSNGYINYPYPASDISVVLSNYENEILCDITNKNGYFEFDSLTNGNYTLNVQVPGYTTLSNSININDSFNSGDSILIIIRKNEIVINNSNDNKTPEITVYPNPVISIFCLDLKYISEATVELELYNTSGDRLYNETIIKQFGKTTIYANISHFVKGMYLGILKYDSTVFCFKIIKE